MCQYCAYKLHERSICEKSQIFAVLNIRKSILFEVYCIDSSNFQRNFQVGRGPG